MIGIPGMLLVPFLWTKNQSPGDNDLRSLGSIVTVKKNERQKTSECSVMETNLLACRNSRMFGYQFVLEFRSRKVSCDSDVMEKFKYLC